MIKDIITKSGKINDYIHHVDLNAFGKKRFLSCYIAEFDNTSIILDCGSSFEIKGLIDYIKNANISFSSIKYLITTHYHFDHNGGAWKLYNILKKHSPKIKILTNQNTKNLLNNYSEHLTRAKRTFGRFTGEMNCIEDEAFQLIEPTNNLKNVINNTDIIESFKLNGSKIILSVLETPGHTPDHQCPIFLREGEPDFIFLGEAAGTLYNSSKLITMPTSMPIHFKYNNYMNSLENIQKLNPNKIGFAHFGIVDGNENTNKILNEHKNYMKEFRKEIIQYYNENPETKYIYNKLMPNLIKRTDLTIDFHPILKKIILAIIYGMMMDLGYRKE
ncbi:MAG: MBL fold metallo-hydrolase [Candidatus Lokiarchaeota archaeon]|nr:MBL fold metallo-hydrolase [Candidatus Lokiarchaeota archaeon]